MSTTTRYRFIVFFLVLELLISKALCAGKRSSATTETELEDDAYDYIDYDYTGDDNENDKNQNDNSSPQLYSTSGGIESPYFEKNSVHISADPNTNVVLNCDVRNFHVNNVVIWYKDQTVYSHGQYTANQRVEASKNNSILIKNVQPEDAGDYYCAVFPENIRLQVVLQVNKLLSILCDGRDVTDRTVVFRQGESHICECRTRGSDSGNIKWSLNGNRFHERLGEINHSSIMLNDVEDYHIGIYQCLDDDGSEQPRYGMFTADVLFSPKVTTHRHHVNTEIGGNAELYCDYKGNPIAITTWLKSNQPIRYSEKYKTTYTMEKNFNRSTLIVNDVTVNDLGEYICRAENSLGSNELRTHLMLEPEKGQLENVLIDGKTVTLQWLVRSLQPLSEAVLDYKTSGSYTWSSTKVIHTKRHENGMWKVTHEMELTEGEWQSRMRTKNIVGWSKFSAPFVFTIKDDATNDLENKNVAMAGFGLNGGVQLTAINTYFQISFLIVLSVYLYVL